MSINLTDGAEYTEVLRQLNTWYGTDAPKIVNIINTYGLTPEQVTQDYLSGSGFEPWYTSSGSVAGYNAVGSFSADASNGSAASSLNSNIGSPNIVGVKTPIETTYNQSGKLVTSNGLTSVATGAKSALTFVQKEVLPAVSAAGLGIALGKVIDKTLYDLNPDFWDNNGMSSLNPDTWNSITSDYPDGFLKRAFNTVFGLNPATGETQQYLDVEAAAYLAQYMQENGVFDTGDQQVTSGDSWSQSQSWYQYITFPVPVGSSGLMYTTDSYSRTITSTMTLQSIIINGAQLYVYSTQGGTVTVDDYYFNIDRHFISNYNISTYTINNKPIASWSTAAAPGAVNVVPVYSNNNINRIGLDNLFYTLLYGTISGGGGVEGITDQDGATQPDFSNCETPSDYINALQTQYPELFNNGVTQTIANPDGTTTTKTFIAIGTPSENNEGNETQPTTDNDNSGNTQSSPSANPNTVNLNGLNTLIKTLTDALNKDGTPSNPQNPNPTGTGTTPPIVAPTGSASALWSVYNPSQAQLNSFGAWLWSSNFIDQILKLFNNPMQSIIGVHKIFATPATSGAGNITVGYLDSGVSANLVSNQYTDINCGSVNVREQFGNVFDYTDTHIRLYLPFVGIVDLDTADVMRGSVSVVYHVDVITGACLAEVKVKRDASGGTLYQFAGDAAVRYPISSGSYMGVVSGILSAVGGVASAVMTGGATLPLAAGAVAGGISGAHTQVQHSGNFSGNAGAMGGKKPYLIIERPQSYVADDFKHWQGLGANARRTVGQMSGYFKFSDVHTESISKAAESEIEAIRAALESGVIA